LTSERAVAVAQQVADFSGQKQAPPPIAVSMHGVRKRRRLRHRRRRRLFLWRIQFPIIVYYYYYLLVFYYYLFVSDFCFSFFVSFSFFSFFFFFSVSHCECLPPHRIEQDGVKMDEFALIRTDVDPKQLYCNLVKIGEG
jgi:hypothetical protein